ncbi:50S ribosomal protein L13 [Venenivibrio stagnispumantis]|uniref:Large ribosomal subunit protein uL13 n=1 Tax=Venenivibrio stagnispumantis TaxID=407998 RepID=A0AA46AF25_9AQUI|nr:50S ribosomal protein L13 [Venenivibrio stagnispumantis]MCW4573706.1 50S ribosomal protein L13 [Venenivibrio stagnispumantis]SMP16062.1 LSU ribosomal protein L13P [Venenivibrio stagnispumantis]
MKTFYLRKEDVKRDWYVIDATGKNLGRLASLIANVLRGKHKPVFQKDVDCGDFVIVLNADKITVTGKKLTDKEYKFHTNRPGGLKVRTLEWMLQNKPEEVLALAVERMLPKNKLQKRFMKRLKIYTGSEHPHQAQNPKPLEDLAKLWKAI